MTEGSPGSVAVSGVEVPVGASAGEPATVGSPDETFGRGATDAEGRWAVQAAVRHASARATRLSPGRFVTVRPPGDVADLRRLPARRDVAGQDRIPMQWIVSPGLSPRETTSRAYLTSRGRTECHVRPSGAGSCSARAWGGDTVKPPGRCPPSLTSVGVSGLSVSRSSPEVVDDSIAGNEDELTPRFGTAPGRRHRRSPVATAEPIRLRAGQHKGPGQSKAGTG